MSEPDKSEFRAIVSAIYEVASAMEGLSQQMQDFEGHDEIVRHGQEMGNAAEIAVSWAQGIERDHELRPADEITPVYPMTTHAMGIHMGGIGDAVMNFVINSRLLSTSCPACPDEGTLTVWSANSAEQIESFVREYLSKHPQS